MTRATYPKSMTNELQRIIEQGNAIIEELGEGKESAASALRSKWSEITESARSTFDKYAETAADKSAQVIEGGKKALEQGRGYVREHPAQATGLAVLAGVIVGVLLARRK